MRIRAALLVVLLAGCHSSSERATCDSEQTRKAVLAYFQESLAESEVPFWLDSHPILSEFKEHSRAGRKVASCMARLDIDVGHAGVGPDAVITELGTAKYLTRTGFGQLVHFDYPNVQRGLPTRTDGNRLQWDIKYSAKIEKIHGLVIVNVDEGEAISDYLGYYASLNDQFAESKSQAK